MDKTRAVLRKTLDQAPGSMRELARAAGVSHGLLTAVRDGSRRLTPATRDGLVAALREWAETCEGLAESLEALDVNPQPGGKHDG